MAGHRQNNVLMCLVFLSSLGVLGLKWFKRLLEESIERLQQLAEAFVTRFKTNTKTPKEVDHLLGIKKETYDFLKVYNAKYWETFSEILNCLTNLAITQYKRNLPIGHRLRDSLTMNQLTTMELLMQRINEHIRVEDDVTAAIVKANPIVVDKRVAGKVNAVGQDDGRANNCGREHDRDANRNNLDKGRNNDCATNPCDTEDDAKRKLKAWISITTVFKISIYHILNEIHDEEYIRWPTKLGDAQRGFNLRYRCTFNDERGHKIEDWMALKLHLEELVTAGHLDRYVDEEVRVAPPKQTLPNGQAIEDIPPQGVID
ncbi:uncharacterized protein LOC114280208 [Camellia sinensis]|uniref:uncharacterized protein LOC114280208 n=1 Tax=Camellia sinensis TaxID=4442 RepID=UPI001035DF4C|nr:uncharacterized protein LOC114280208 [Camellia sinensis]